MGKLIEKAFYIDAKEMADHCGDEPDFLAETLNHLGGNDGSNISFTWLRDFAAALDDKGEAALRAMVARLDAIDASSTEGR